MIILGQLAALGTAFCWSFTAIFFSYSGRLVGSSVVNRSRLVFAMLFISISHLILVGTVFPFEAEPYRWGWLALSSILGLVLGDTFLFRAYVLVGPRLSMLMMSTVPILSRRSSARRSCQGRSMPFWVMTRGRGVGGFPLTAVSAITNSTPGLICRSPSRTAFHSTLIIWRREPIPRRSV